MTPTGCEDVVTDDEVSQSSLKLDMTPTLRLANEAAETKKVAVLTKIGHDSYSNR